MSYENRRARQSRAELGLTLTEIRELLALGFEPNTPAAAVKARAEAKIAHIDTVRLTASGISRGTP